MLVDLRSDTVTRPTAAMRRAMAEAEVGDDGYREDPTVTALEERYAELTGKEAALFVPSGTMANQLALGLIARPGTRVVVGARQHIVRYEQGASGRYGLYQLHPVPDPAGVLDAEEVDLAIESGQGHAPEVSALSAECTHMPSGGTPLPLAALERLRDTGLPVHLDGARLFNAAVATGLAVSTYAATATTVMSCLSKGLGAPVGSLLAMPAELAAPARRERKRLGGGMRQAGVVAAGGLVALDTMVDRLAEDHERAARLVEAVRQRWPDTAFEPGGGGTNLVVFGHPRAAAIVEHLRTWGVLAGMVAPRVIRLAVHADVDEAGIERARAAVAAAP